MEHETFKKLSIFSTLALLIALSIVVIWPIAIPIVTGLLLAYIFYPVYKKIFSWTGKKSISALIIILAILFLVCIPLWYLLPSLVGRVFDLYLSFQNINVLDFIRDVYPSLANTDFSVSLASSINSFISDLASGFFSSMSDLVLDIPNLALKVAVVFFVFFFGMRDGQTFSNYVKSLSPFTEDTEERLSKKFKDVTHSVIYGFIIIGIMQGILTGIGLAFAGIPRAFILTFVAIIAAIIPVLGSWIVWVPAVIYLFLGNHYLAAILLLIYGAIFISWVDNILRPYLVARRIKISSAVVFIGMIGGLLVFGILGFIIGPLVLAYLLLLLDSYRNENFPSLFTMDEGNKNNVSLFFSK